MKKTAVLQFEVTAVFFSRIISLAAVVLVYLRCPEILSRPNALRRNKCGKWSVIVFQVLGWVAPKGCALPIPWICIRCSEQVIGGILRKDKWIPDLNLISFCRLHRCPANSESLTPCRKYVRFSSPFPLSVFCLPKFFAHFRVNFYTKKYAANHYFSNSSNAKLSVQAFFFCVAKVLTAISPVAANIHSYENHLWSN